MTVSTHTILEAGNRSAMNNLTRENMHAGSEYQPEESTQTTETSAGCSVTNASKCTDLHFKFSI